MDDIIYPFERPLTLISVFLYRLLYVKYFREEERRRGEEKERVTTNRCLSLEREMERMKDEMERMKMMMEKIRVAGSGGEMSTKKLEKSVDRLEEKLNRIHRKGDEIVRYDVAKDRVREMVSSVRLYSSASPMSGSSGGKMRTPPRKRF